MTTYPHFLPMNPTQTTSLIFFSSPPLFWRLLSSNLIWKLQIFLSILGRHKNKGNFHISLIAQFEYACLSLMVDPTHIKLILLLGFCLILYEGLSWINGRKYQDRGWKFQSMASMGLGFCVIFSCNQFNAQPLILMCGVVDLKTEFEGQFS